MAQPRIGHMMEVLHIFSYLKAHENSKLVFDPMPQAWDEGGSSPLIGVILTVMPRSRFRPMHHSQEGIQYKLMHSKMQTMQGIALREDRTQGF